MDDEPSDVGITAPGEDELGLDPAVDKAARDLEFTLFYTQDMPRLTAFLMVYGARPRSVAEIVAHEAMSFAYESWDVIERPRAWVRTTAARMWLKRHAQNKMELAYDELPPSPWAQEAVPSTADQIETRHVLLSVLRELPLVQRAVLAYHYDGYTSTEIATFLGKQPSTVRATKRDALVAVRRRLPPLDAQGAS
jgi:RNA polymerase sigma-70 factor (ECF subfamily)